MYRPPGTPSLAEQLLRLLDDGRRTGTHKLVLLLGILTALEEAADRSGRVPETLPVRAVARPIVRLLWQQVAPFVPPGSSDAIHLRQMRPNGRGEPSFWKLTREARQRAEAQGLPDLAALERDDPAFVEGLVTRIVAAAVKNPVPRLQVIGGDHVPFLYHWRWGTDRSPRPVVAEQGRDDGEPQLAFLPHAAAELLRLAAILRPVIEERIVNDVATYNNLHTAVETVRDHLFGVERWAIPKVLRDALREAQDNRCAYCNVPLTRESHVDHFVPWVWRPNNAVDNLLVVDCRCNAAKHDRLAGLEHVESWVEGLPGRVEIGRQLGPDVTGVYTDAARSVGIARRSYGQLGADRRLWVAADQPPRPAGLRELAAINATLDRALRVAGGGLRATIDRAAETAGDWQIPERDGTDAGAGEGDDR